MIADSPTGAILTLKVIPRAGKTVLAGTRDGALLVRLAAPPVEGAANAALVAWLAGLLHLPKNRLELVGGATSRSKRVRVKGMSAVAVAKQLGLA